MSRMPIRRVIVNTCNQKSNYLSLRDTMKQSLIGENLYFRDVACDNLTIYEEKINTIKKAAELGYNRILQLDVSLRAIRPLDDIWEYIDKNGYYFYKSGFTCDQSCNDDCLAYYGMTREEAANVIEVASNVVGINLDHKDGKRFFKSWTDSIKSTANRGIKWPTEQERLLEGSGEFLHHRQDQSTASLSSIGLKREEENHFIFRHEREYEMNESVIFILKGV